MRRRQPHGSRLLLGSNPHRPRSADQREWIVPDKLCWSFQFKLDGIVGEGPDGAKFVGHAQHYASGVGPVCHEAGVVGQQREFLIDTFAGIFLHDDLLALNVSLETQVAPLVKKFAQFHDKWRVTKVRELLPVGINRGDQFVRDIKLYLVDSWSK